MKVILLKDVKGAGKRYEVKYITDGYALNMLIPKGLAEAATEKAIKRVELMRAQDLQDKKIQEDLLIKNLKVISEAKITLTEKANDKGHLFAQIHKEEISKAVKAQTHLDILPEFIILKNPIKEVGEHTIEVKVQDKEVKFGLSVQALA